MRRLKWLFFIASALIAVVLFLPLATKWYVIQSLEKQGYQVQIRHLGMDFLSRKFSLSGVHMVSDKGAKLDLLSAEVRLDLSSLFTSQIVINRLNVSHFKIDVSLTDGAYEVVGFPFAKIVEALTGKSLDIQLMQLEFSQACRLPERQCLKIDEAAFSKMVLSYNEPWVVHFDGTSRIKKLFLMDATSDTALLFAEALEINRSRLNSDGASLHGVVAKNWQYVESIALQGAETGKLQTQWGELQLASLNLRYGAPANLKLGEMKLTSLRQAVVDPRSLQHSQFKDYFGFWLPPLTAVTNAFEQEQIEFETGAIELVDGSLNWADYSVSPAVQESVTGLKLLLGPLNSAQSSGTSKIEATFKFAKNGLMKLEGEVQALSPEPQFSVNGILQDAQMANFSAYTESLLGQQVHSGVVDVGFDLSYRDTVLSGETLWRLTQLRVEESADRSNMMPFSVAFDVLQDRNQSVPFKLDLQLDKREGELNLRHLFGLIRAELNDLARRQVNPAGAVAIRPRVSGQATMEFRSIYYDANMRAPREEDRERLEDVVNLLKGKPHLSMVFCPVITASEWAHMFNDGQIPSADQELLPEQKKLLLELAQSRARALHTILLEKGIDDTQIVSCGPSVDMQKTGASYISLSM